MLPVLMSFTSLQHGHVIVYDRLIAQQIAGIAISADCGGPHGAVKQNICLEELIPLPAATDGDQFRCVEPTSVSADETTVEKAFAELQELRTNLMELNSLNERLDRCNERLDRCREIRWANAWMTSKIGCRRLPRRRQIVPLSWFVHDAVDLVGS